MWLRPWVTCMAYIALLVLSDIIARVPAKIKPNTRNLGHPPPLRMLCGREDQREETCSLSLGERAWSHTLPWDTKLMLAIQYINLELTSLIGFLGVVIFTPSRQYPMRVQSLTLGPSICITAHKISCDAHVNCKNPNLQVRRKQFSETIESVYRVRLPFSLTRLIQHQHEGLLSCTALEPSQSEHNVVYIWAAHMSELHFCYVF